MTSQQTAKTMKPEKVLEYLVQENDIHYQHYYAMKELLLSYKLPVSMLKTTDEPKAFFDKLYLSYRNPPSIVGSRMTEDTSELIEEVIKNNQEIRGFNARMSKEVVGFVNTYNDWIMEQLGKDESNSPACWNSMKESMKRLVQEEEEWKAERANLEGELFLLSNEKCETEERELSALRTKVQLQKDLRCANEMISHLEKIHSCCEEKLKKRKEKSLPKKIFEFFCKQIQRKIHSWEEDGREMKVTPHMAQDGENSDDDDEDDDATENSDDDDVVNSDDDTENSDEDDDDVVNSEDDAENSDEDVENSEEDVNSYKLIENSDEDTESSDEDVENSDDDTDPDEDMVELSFIQKQKSDINRWYKVVEKQLEEARDIKRSYKQCIEVLMQEAKAIKKTSAKPKKAP